MAGAYDSPTLNGADWRVGRMRKLQRQELEQTRKVMQEQEAQMRASAEAAQRQLFESTFFSLLGSFQQYIESIGFQVGSDGRAYQGRDAFEHHISLLLALENRGLQQARQLEDAARVYIPWFRSQDHRLRPYVDMLLAVFDFIDGSSRSNKVFYFELVRATLSRHEKTLLFYHGLCIKEHERLQRYIERYSLLREVDPAFVHRSEVDISIMYQASAYDPLVPYKEN